MKPGQTPQEAYRDLLERARVYFLRIYPDRNPETRPPAGVRQWLLDLDAAEMWESIERYHEEETEEIDVPL